MEYMPLDDSSIKIDNQCDILKRNIDEIISNEDESHRVLNKRMCAVEDEEKPRSKDSHANVEWDFINNDFEHATSAISLVHNRTLRTNPMPIIFHYASEDILDIGQCDSDNINTALHSMCSADILPVRSVHNFCSTSMEKLSQGETKKEQETIAEYISSHKPSLMMIDKSHKQDNVLHQIDPTFNKCSSLSTSDTSLDRSLDRLQANYRRYLAKRKTETKSNIHQYQQSISIDSQAYIRCRKHRRSIPVQLIASDPRGKLFRKKSSHKYDRLSKNKS